MLFASVQLGNVMGVINRNVTERYWTRRLWVGGALAFFGRYRTHSRDRITGRELKGNVEKEACKKNWKFLVHCNKIYSELRMI